MEKRYNGPERRKSVRVNTNFPVLYDIDPDLKVRLTVKRKIFNAIAKNLSGGGMSILTNVELPISASASLDFTLCNMKEAVLSKRPRRIEANCRTLYSFSLPDGSYRVGIQFVNLPEEDRCFIAKYVKDYSKSRAK